MTDKLPIETFVPGKTESRLNAREHWTKRHRTARRQRENTHWALIEKRKLAVESDLDEIPLVVTLTRVSPNHQRLDDDNLAGALKSIRDGVADWLRINDNDPRVTWRYAQDSHSEYGVRIRIAKPD